SLNQKRIGSMASFPPRLPNLKQAVESLLPQLDELHIYLNGYAEVPEFLNDQKITTYLGKDCAGDLRDNGKFFSLPNHEGYIFTLDDDINYPSDYVSKMIAQIELLNRSCVIGLHGVIFPKEKAAKFVENRTVLHFKDAHGYAFVDLIGTGTAAFHSSTLNINLSNFKTTGICDVWFAATCHRAGIPLMSVERPENWLTAQETVGVNLFTEAKSEEKSGHGHTKIYNEVLYGLLKPAPPRAYYEAQLLEKYGAEALELKHYTFFEMEAQAAQNRAAAKTHRTTIFNAEKKCLPKRRSIPHLHVIVNGWNCVGFVNDCLKSLRDQDAGAYTLEISAVDDGSTDGTLEALLDFGQLPNMRVFTNNKNYGPAFSRHQAIKEITDPDTVVILLDLDDWLKPDALTTIASAYRNNTKCLMTCGNWHNQHGKMNPLDFYTAEQIDNNLHRKMQKFHAAPLRTFRRKLYDAIEVTDLKGPHGEWLQTCTDVAIMLPLLDQCKSQNVQFIKKPLYVYNEKHGLGTLVRFGKPYKEERLQWIKSKEPKHLI
ncbi:glycosyltransferase family 2 protein, partial [uncultured Lentibacter sp.]|uniref:glycosyltransferase family 2 protein n=1 Tax=uncultured Lentibacter sp. TaxID=1659309 RepID=UPI00261D66B7